MLLLTEKLLVLLLPVAQQQQAQAASSSSSSSSSSPPGEMPGSSSSSSSSAQEMFHSSLQSGLDGLWAMYAALSGDHIAPYVGLETPHESWITSRAERVCCPEVPVLRADRAVWFQHASKTCEVLEAYVREAAQSQAAGRHYLLLGNMAAGLGDAIGVLVDPSEAGLRGPLLQAAAAAGPGSKEQQQLHGLLRSTVKWAGTMEPEQQPLAEQLRAAVAVAAATMLLAAKRTPQADDLSSGAAVSVTAKTGDRASSSAAAGCSSHHQGGGDEQPAQPSAHMQHAAPPGAKAESAAAASSSAAVLSDLPWLGVLGCCCLQWSQQLGSLPTDNTAAAEAAARSGAAHRSKGVITVLPAGLRSVWGTAVVDFTDDRSLVWLCIDAAHTWLEAKFTLQPELIMQWVSPRHLDELLTAVNGSLRACYNVRRFSYSSQMPRYPLLRMCSSWMHLVWLCALCRTSSLATTPSAETCRARQSCSWSRAGATPAQAAALPGTAALSACGSTGSSTGQCARRWARQLPQCARTW